LLGIQVSLNPTLTRNDKVEQHKKTHKHIGLKFWVGSNVNLLYGCISYLIGVWISLVNPSQKWYQSQWFVLVINSDKY